MPDMQKGPTTAIERLRAENDYEERDRHWAALLDCAEALAAVAGYMRNAAIGLETGATKKTAIATVNGGLKIADAALAALERAGK